jgi:hypothetical protein
MVGCPAAEHLAAEDQSANRLARQADWPAHARTAIAAADGRMLRHEAGAEAAKLHAEVHAAMAHLAAHGGAEVVDHAIACDDSRSCMEAARHWASVDVAGVVRPAPAAKAAGH